MSLCRTLLFFFFFNDTATTEIYPLSLHDALPICIRHPAYLGLRDDVAPVARRPGRHRRGRALSSAQQCRQSLLARSEEHTSELQSLAYLVCRLLLEKKKQYRT